MVVTGFYKDVTRLCVNNPTPTGNPYRGLAAAIVLQAVRDWEWCCRRCACGKDYFMADCNFYELERFFREIAPRWVADVIDTDAMLQSLLADKTNAYRTRARRGFTFYGQELNKERTRLGVSRRELSELTGYSLNQIERWESGDCDPSQSQQIKIRESLKQKRLPQ